MAKWKLHIKHFCRKLKYDGCVRRSTHAIIWVASWTSWLVFVLFFSWNTIFAWENSWQIMVISTWVFGRHFLENQLSNPVSSRTTIDYLLPMVKKSQISKGTWNFGKLVSPSAWQLVSISGLFWCDRSTSCLLSVLYVRILSECSCLKHTKSSTAETGLKLAT